MPGRSLTLHHRRGPPGAAGRHSTWHVRCSHGRSGGSAMANCSAASATTIEDPTALSSPARTDDWGFRARVIAAILRRAVRIFFRDIEIVGLERVPTGGPLVLVANHVNGIVDPLLVGLLGLRARFLAKSTLWSNPIIRPLLDLTGGIPVYRHQDAGEDTSKNADS